MGNGDQRGVTHLQQANVKVHGEEQQPRAFDFAQHGVCGGAAN